MSEEEVIIKGYRRVNVLQTGQNSEVWEVVDTTSAGRQRYAMKLLLSEKVADRSQRAMLTHEANVNKSLDHPKIIKFYKYVRDRKSPFILMEYFPYPNLKLRLMRNQYESVVKPKLREIIEQTASALEHLHSKKWVHRDVKPDNLLVSSTGEIRLIDFALSVRIATGFSRLFTRRGKLTAGTRSYMSPEQIRSQPLDERSDIYSFGVMLYEVVAGRVPFVGGTGADLLRKHLAEAPPPIPSDRGITPEFEELLIQKMLAKNPKNRLKNLTEFLSSFRRLRIYKEA